MAECITALQRHNSLAILSRTIESTNCAIDPPPHFLPPPFARRLIPVSELSSHRIIGIVTEDLECNRHFEFSNFNSLLKIFMIEWDRPGSFLVQHFSEIEARELRNIFLLPVVISFTSPKLKRKLCLFRRKKKNNNKMQGEYLLTILINFLLSSFLLLASSKAVCWIISKNNYFNENLWA